MTTGIGRWACESLCTTYSNARWETDSLVPISWIAWRSELKLWRNGNKTQRWSIEAAFGHSDCNWVVISFDGCYAISCPCAHCKFGSKAKIASGQSGLPLFHASVRSIRLVYWMMFSSLLISCLSVSHFWLDTLTNESEATISVWEPPSLKPEWFNHEIGGFALMDWNFQSETRLSAKPEKGCWLSGLCHW